MTPPINSVSPERLEKFIETCAMMADGGDGLRYQWWDDLTFALRELATRRAANTPVDGVERADMLVKLARIIARNIDDERYYSAAPFQRAADEILTLLSPALPSQVVGVTGLVDYLWQEICELPDRTSPEEYPDMGMVTLKELTAIIETWAERSCLTSPAAEPVAWTDPLCTTCAGTGEVITDNERYLHPHDGDKGDEAVADCPDCDGLGYVEVADYMAANPDASEARPTACTGCGSMRTDEQCRVEQRSCCPDRHMVPVDDLIASLWAKAYPSPAVEAEPVATASLPEHAKWCQPGDRQDKRHFLVRFDDPDCRDSVFTDEDEARKFYARATLSWNCWLFGALPAHPAPSASREVTITDEMVRAADAAHERYYSKLMFDQNTGPSASDAMRAALTAALLAALPEREG